MERLTDERAVIEPGTYLVSDDLLDDVPEIRNVSKKELYYRLGLIENVLGKNYDLGHLRELIEADREGRCVVLPVKLGDTIYSIREDFYNYRKHSGVQRGKVEGFEYDKTWMIWVRLDDAIPRTRNAFKVKDFGKVIFNNRKAAESALKAMKESEEK